MMKATLNFFSETCFPFTEVTWGVINLVEHKKYVPKKCLRSNDIVLNLILILKQRYKIPPPDN